MTFLSSLTQGERASFKAYRAGTESNKNFSYDLNQKLKSDDGIPKRFKSHLIHLDNLTLKTKLQSEVTLYRATYGDTVESLLNGKVYKGFIAASDKNNCLGRYFTQHSSALNTDAYYIIIKCPKGSRVAIFDESRQQTSTDYLIPRGSRFSLVSREEVTNSADIRALAGTINARKLKKIIKVELVLKKRSWLLEIQRKMRK